MPTPRNLLPVPSEISLQSLPMAIVDLLLCSTRECSVFQIQCHGFSGDVQVMSCSCFTGKSINYHAASLSFHDAIPNSHTPSLPGIGKACVVLFACDVGREDGEKAMLPVKDIDLSSVKYEHEVIEAPRLTGFGFRLFVRILETPLIGPAS